MRLYKGKTELIFEDASIIAKFYEKEILNPELLIVATPPSNHIYILISHGSSALGRYNSKSRFIENIEIKNIYGIHPRNAEQYFTMHVLINPNVLLTTITGSAGAGKTLIALAGALEQRSNFKQIYLA
tara:strand:- start:6628 stop:7011 length:384 start_codon:yes stop_codon:yes gene_type:complete